VVTTCEQPELSAITATVHWDTYVITLTTLGEWPRPRAAAGLADLILDIEMLDIDHAERAGWPGGSSGASTPYRRAPYRRANTMKVGQ